MLQVVGSNPIARSGSDAHDFVYGAKVGVEAVEIVEVARVDDVAALGC